MNSEFKELTAAIDRIETAINKLGGSLTDKEYWESVCRTVHYYDLTTEHREMISIMRGKGC